MKVRDHLTDLVKSWCAQRGLVLAKYASDDRRALLQDVMRLKSTGHLQQNPAEGCQLVNALRATARVAGDIAEVGTSRGGSARLIGEYSRGKTIHVFDTFEGLPEPGAQDFRFSKGAYSCSLEKVQEYLKGLPVEFHKGIFPHSAKNISNRRFSFVHLDVDLYRSTLDCLKFFYPRLNLGGIIISHDYTTAEGVNQAFEEFFSDKTETPIELIGYQVMAVKLSDHQNVDNIAIT